MLRLLDDYMFAAAYERDGKEVEFDKNNDESNIEYVSGKDGKAGVLQLVSDI